LSINEFAASLNAAAIAEAAAIEGPLGTQGQMFFLRVGEGRKKGHKHFFVCLHFLDEFFKNTYLLFITHQVIVFQKIYSIGIKQSISLMYNRNKL